MKEVATSIIVVAIITTLVLPRPGFVQSQVITDIANGLSNSIRSMLGVNRS